jgi:glyoxylase-like metal-dependent hydrolase (beta-lactamase superfamily II)
MNVQKIHTLDLHFLGIDHAIAAYLIETSAGPILIETGPHSTFESMKLALANHGYAPSDIQHVFLTHIHFDHAGAAWAFAAQGAKIYLHPFGAPHMEDPTKLYNSAKQIYGDDMERLWGLMEKIPHSQLISPAHNEEIVIGDTTLRALHTPGHAKHHIAWQMGDVIFTGDVAGVKIGNGPVVPPCPPPDINLEDWNESIDILLASDAKTLYLTHFGEVKNKEMHLSELREILNDWAMWIKEKWESGMDAEAIVPLFKAYTSKQLEEKGVNAHGLKQYEAANPSEMSVAGLIRYWKKKTA